MTPIKILLLVPLLAVLILTLTARRHKKAYRLLFVALVVTGIVFVLDPELTNVIAHALNVSRGADLVFYISGVAGFCAVVVLYSKVRAISAQTTAVIRELAIQGARVPGTNGPGSTRPHTD